MAISVPVDADTTLFMRNIAAAQVAAAQALARGQALAAEGLAKAERDAATATAQAAAKSRAVAQSIRDDWAKAQQSMSADSAKGSTAIRADFEMVLSKFEGMRTIIDRIAPSLGKTGEGIAKFASQTMEFSKAGFEVAGAWGAVAGALISVGAESLKAIGPIRLFGETSEDIAEQRKKGFEYEKYRTFEIPRLAEEAAERMKKASQTEEEAVAALERKAQHAGLTFEEMWRLIGGKDMGTDSLKHLDTQLDNIQIKVDKLYPRLAELNGDRSGFWGDDNQKDDQKKTDARAKGADALKAAKEENAKFRKDQMKKDADAQQAREDALRVAGQKRQEVIDKLAEEEHQSDLDRAAQIREADRKWEEDDLARKKAYWEEYSRLAEESSQRQSDALLSLQASYTSLANDALEPFGQIAGTVFSQVNDNIEQSNRAWAGLGKAVKKGVADALKALAKKWGVAALGEAAEALGSLAIGDFKSAGLHTLSAVEYGVAALAAGYGGARLSRGAGGGAGAGSGGGGNGGGGGSAGGGSGLGRGASSGPTNLAPILVSFNYSSVIPSSPRQIQEAADQLHEVMKKKSGRTF